MEPVIYPLSVSRLDDFLEFFDNHAFCDNPEWSGCYCIYNYFAEDDVQWEKRTAQENREQTISLIQNGAMSGYLAYNEGKVAGWLNAGDKAAYARYAHIASEPEKRTAAVTCFVIAKPCRRQGVARALLLYALGDFAAQGYHIVEAYPLNGADNAAMHYRGHPAILEAAGFVRYKDYQDFRLMRKTL